MTTRPPNGTVPKLYVSQQDENTTSRILLRFQCSLMQIVEMARYSLDVDRSSPNGECQGLPTRLELQESWRDGTETSSESLLEADCRVQAS